MAAEKAGKQPGRCARAQVPQIQVEVSCSVEMCADRNKEFPAAEE